MELKCKMQGRFFVKSNIVYGLCKDMVYTYH